jgi:TatD DNase family protein
LSPKIIETDAPWCGIKQTHPGHKYIKTNFSSRKKDKYVEGMTVKDRNEPCMIVQVFEVLAAMRNEPNPSEFAEILFQNSEKLFFSK